MDTRDFIAKRIKELRTKKLGITADKLGKLLKPSRSGKTISSWETGRTQPDSDTLLQLSAIFAVPIESLYPPKPSQGFTSEGSYIDVPLYGSIAAGKPLAIIPVEDTHPIPAEMHRKFPQGFLLKVEGESMNNVLPHGSYALIDPSSTTLQNNGAYALCINGNDATIKRIKQLESGCELIPDSKDPTFKSNIYDYSKEDPDEITIIGQVVWMMLPFDWEI